MKVQSKKVIAVALAMTMCVPAAAFAAEEGPKTGSFKTDFDIYSPVLTVSVPTDAKIRVNPIADSSATSVKKFTVASNSIDILNASVDVEQDVAIPVNATINATITSKADDVITKYGTFTADNTSTKKKVHLNLAQAGTAAVFQVKATGGAAAFDTDKKLDLTQYEVKTAADYTTPTKSSPITVYGSLLSVDIAGPATSDGTTGATFSTDASKVTPAVGSFAVTGVANTNADWKETDLAVAITYNVRASQTLNITNPTVDLAAGKTGVEVAAGTDVSIVVKNIGEATVAGIALHDDEAGSYGDVIFAEGSYTVTTAPDATTTTQTNATITIPSDHECITFIAGDNYKNKPQEFLVALSDGRVVTTTLTITVTATP